LLLGTVNTIYLDSLKLRRLHFIEKENYLSFTLSLCFDDTIHTFTKNYVHKYAFSFAYENTTITIVCVLLDIYITG